MRTPVIALVLFFLAFPTVAQMDEGHPYFSLSSNRTFGTGEKPTIQLWAQGVDMLQFRVYRVNDPVKFFEGLGDQHRFGGQTKPPARELTAIEKFHQWKSRSRAAMRNLFRAQYTAESRAAVRQLEAAREQKSGGSQTRSGHRIRRRAAAQRAAGGAGVAAGRAARAIAGTRRPCP